MELIIADLKGRAPFDTAKDELRKNYYWLVLSLMFTGARLGELLHLPSKAVYETEGVWIFDLKPRDGRKLKTKSSTRKVPLHAGLIEAGFLDYVTSCKGPLLFPALEGPGVRQRVGGSRRV